MGGCVLSSKDNADAGLPGQAGVLPARRSPCASRLDSLDPDRLPPSRLADGAGTARVRRARLNTGEPMESRIERLCVERGLKMTGQRRVIARVLSEAADHPDVEELYRRASTLDARISIATVYRTVRLLEEKGILERRDFGGGRARYEPTEHGHHFHLIDIDTGKVIEFQDPEYERLMQVMAERLGFDLVSLRLELFGRRRDTAQASRDREARQRLSRRIGGSSHDPDPAAEQGRAAR
jgi:Fur family transcriptional regulator, ferric uptake regulator